MHPQRIPHPALVPFQPLHEGIDTLHLLRYVYTLRTMRIALAAAYAMAGLAQPGHTAVIADKECTTGLPVMPVALAAGHVPLIDALVVVEQDSGDVQPVGTRHAILAVVARIVRYCIIRTAVSCRKENSSSDNGSSGE